MLAGLEAAQAKVEQMAGFGKRKNSKTGELERMSTTAKEEARRLSVSRNSGPGSEAARAEARAAVGQGNVATGSAVADDTAAPAPRRNSIFGKKTPTSPTKQ